MGLYIECGYLPEKGNATVLRIFPDGKIYVQQSGLYECYEMPVLHAIEVKEPHGDLIDRQELIDVMTLEMCGTGYQGLAVGTVRSDFTAPTVIPEQGV